MLYPAYDASDEDSKREEKTNCERTVFASSELKDGIDEVPAARDECGTGEFSGWDGEILIVSVNPCDVNNFSL